MESVLKESGFSEREVKVYLALLKLGISKVGPIAACTRLQHSKVYQTLEKLIDKGLVVFVIKSGIKHFEAQNPKQILSMLKEKERKFQEIMPKLKEMQELSQDSQSSRVYEGYKSIKSMFNSIIDELDNKSFYYVFAFKDEYESSESASRFLRNIHMRLVEKKVDDRLIAHVSVKKSFLKNYSDIRRIKFKFTKNNMPLGLMIINDRVINWIWGERPTAIEIRSKQIADQYKKFFLEMWKSSIS